MYLRAWEISSRVFSYPIKPHVVCVRLSHIDIASMKVKSVHKYTQLEGLGSLQCFQWSQGAKHPMSLLFA